MLLHTVVHRCYKQVLLHGTLSVPKCCYTLLYTGVTNRCYYMVLCLPISVVTHCCTQVLQTGVTTWYSVPKCCYTLLYTGVTNRCYYMVLCLPVSVVTHWFVHRCYKHVLLHVTLYPGVATWHCQRCSWSQDEQVTRQCHRPHGCHQWGYLAGMLSTLVV